MSTISNTTHIPPTGGKIDALARRMAAWPSSQIVRTVGSFAGTISGTLAGIGVVMIFCITVAEIITRKILGQSLLWSTEVQLFTIASISFVGIAYTLREEGHVRMTLIYSRMSPQTQRVMDFIVTLFALLWTGFFFYASYLRMTRALANDESTAGIIDIPFWMGMLWMVVGSILLAMVLLSRLIKVMAAERFGQAKSAEETDRF